MYSIGEFSRMTGLSIKALRIYHDRGIIVPIVDEQSGYRYYRDKHLEKARAIKGLKGLTFSLADIASILADFADDGEALDMFIAKRDELQVKVTQLQRKAQSIDDIISREKEAMALDNDQFEVERKNVDAMLVATKRWKGRYEECDDVFAKLFKTFGFRVNGKPLNLYYDEGCMDDGGADIETCVPIRKGQATDEFDVKQLHAGECLSLIHKGPYHTVGRSYQKLFDYIKQHNLAAALPYREIYIKGPGMIFKGNPKNYLTEIQVMI